MHVLKSSIWSGPMGNEHFHIQIWYRNRILSDPGVKHQKILPRSNTQLYYNNGGHNNNLKTLRRFHDVDDVTVKDNQ